MDRIPVQERGDRCGRMSRGGAWLALGALVLVAGCSIEWQNRQAARELEERARPPGSVYAGWRVYQDRCARCHGETATGRADAPSLVQAVATMGPRRFVDRVLFNYEWDFPSGPRVDPSGRAALVDDVLERRLGAIEMPAWQGEPRVQAHVMDLYAYLSARAQGSQGPGRPSN